MWVAWNHPSPGQHQQLLMWGWPQHTLPLQAAACTTGMPPSLSTLQWGLQALIYQRPVHQQQRGLQADQLLQMCHQHSRHLQWLVCRHTLHSYLQQEHKHHLRSHSRRVLLPAGGVHHRHMQLFLLKPITTRQHWQVVRQSGCMMVCKACSGPLLPPPCQPQLMPHTHTQQCQPGCTKPWLTQDQAMGTAAGAAAHRMQLRQCTTPWLRQLHNCRALLQPCLTVSTSVLAGVQLYSLLRHQHSSSPCGRVYMLLSACCKGSQPSPLQQQTQCLHLHRRLRQQQPQPVLLLLVAFQVGSSWQQALCIHPAGSHPSQERSCRRCRRQ